MAVPTEFELTFGCGHVGTIDLSALPADRRGSRLEFLRSKGVCGDCFEATRDKRRELDRQRWVTQRRREEQDGASDWTREHHFPPLTGSRKQVPFAERIRFELLRDLYTWCVQERNDAVAYARAEVAARGVDEARWWLDQKHVVTEPGDLLELLFVAVASRDGQVCENTV